MLQWIIGNLPNSFLLSEAYLVEYCYFVKKDYNNAEASLTKLKTYGTASCHNGCPRQRPQVIRRYERPV